MRDATLLARRKAAYRPGRRFPGGQPANRNAVKPNCAARQARERRRAVRLLLDDIKWALNIARRFTSERHVYEIHRDGAVERRIYEVRPVEDQSGRLRRTWLRIPGEEGGQSKVQQRSFSNSSKDHTVGFAQPRRASHERRAISAVAPFDRLRARGRARRRFDQPMTVLTRGRTNCHGPPKRRLFEPCRRHPGRCAAHTGRRLRGPWGGKIGRGWPADDGRLMLRGI
jgi:hypothetical protein